MGARERDKKGERGRIRREREKRGEKEEKAKLKCLVCERED